MLRVSTDCAPNASCDPSKGIAAKAFALLGSPDERADFWERDRHYHALVYTMFFTG